MWEILEIMPFTLSHAAAAIPFRRTPLVMSAIVMGCFVPDFPYLLSLSPRRLFGHTLAGMFVLDLPLAMAALWLFHTFIKQPLLTFLPAGFRRRLTAGVGAFPFRPLGRLSLLALSILTGTATHLLWDACTHDNSWICRNLAFLRIRVELPAIGVMPAYTLLEYASSAFGLAVTAIWTWHWYRTTKPSAAPIAHPADTAQRRIFVVGLPALAALGGALRAYHANGLRLQIRPVVHFTADMLISTIAFFLLGLFVYGVILRRHRAVSVGT